MNFEREWLAALALNLVDSKNFSPRRTLELLITSKSTENQSIKATINALVIETIRRKNIIDKIANHVLNIVFQNKKSRIPSLKRLDAKLKNFLRIMIYRLKFEMHPFENILNTTRFILSVKYGGYIDLFVNLLHLINDIDINSLIASVDDPLEQLALKTWEPYFLVKRFTEIYKSESDSILNYFKNISPVFIRINDLKDSSKAFEEFDLKNAVLEQDGYMKDVFKVLRSDVPMARFNGFKEGYFYIQSRTSSLIAHLLNPHDGEYILDACAAPGSKTSHILSLTRDKCRITALEIDPKRLNMLQNTLERQNIHSVEIVKGDARSSPFSPERRFDKILVDAPCTGSGTLANKPYAKWRIKNSLVSRYSQLQYEILSEISKYLKVGGSLLYSTCSLLPEENENIVEEFLKKHTNFETQEVPFPDLGENIPFKGKRYLPHKVDSEGFTVFLLKKKMEI
jgi:16S rRNA (cytosine967-C5)-methyltransferase